MHFQQVPYLLQIFAPMSPPWWGDPDNPFITFSPLPAPDHLSSLTCLLLLCCLFFNNLYAQRGTCTHNPKIRSRMLFWLGQPAASLTCFYLLYNSPIYLLLISCLSPLECQFHEDMDFCLFHLLCIPII